MSFLPSALYEKCYSPEQVEILRSVYETIAAEPWFVKNQEKRNEFAAKIILMFNRGLVTREKLQTFCYVMARHYFTEAFEINEADQPGPQ